jgi:hypothetical protein
MKTATFIKDTRNEPAKQKLYRFDPPLEEHDWNDKLIGTHEYVIVSAVVAMFTGPETYLFAADAEGNITCWTDLHDSMRGTLNHDTAIRNAGYTPVYGKEE